MSIRHNFETLASSGYELLDAEIERTLANWLLIMRVWETCLRDETNIRAFARYIGKRSDETSICLVQTSLGELIALVDPEDDEAIRLSIHAMGLISEGYHFNEEAYHEALDEACEEDWADMDYADRIELLTSIKESVALAFQDSIPSQVIPLLHEAHE